MITRFALFEGSVKPGQTDAFRAAVLDRLVPLWKQFPGNTDVRVMFGDDRDEGAPEFPLILAISYPDTAAMEGALDSPYRAQSRGHGSHRAATFSYNFRNHHHNTGNYQA